MTTPMTSGERLARAEARVGGTLRAVVKAHEDEDRETASAIRRAASELEAAELVAAIRRGRPLTVLLVGGCAVAGAATGALAQKAVDNYKVKGVPIMVPAGVAASAVGVFTPLSFSLRSMLAAGGLSFATGAVIYSMTTHADGGMP